MLIIGIETTCDETGIALVENGEKIVFDEVASSVSLQKKYKGVVPEVAAREQIKVIIPLILASLEEIKLKEIDAIAVAYGPGLVGSLLIGVETAKTLAIAWKKPLIPVNHLIGHLYANWIEMGKEEPQFPLIGLVVSGGHTDLILMKGHGDFKWLGGTRDDSAGEAFDKISRLLGLGYPGGPAAELAARNFKSQVSNLKFPRPMIDSADFDFSFSGLKTAVANFVEKNKLSKKEVAEIAFAFQKSISEVLTKKTIKAAKRFGAKSIVVGGGVSANDFLRKMFLKKAGESHLKIYFPQKKLSTDNGAMIAAAAFYNFKKIDPLKLQVNPGLYF